LNEFTCYRKATGVELIEEIEKVLIELKKKLSGFDISSTLK
jgi:hypothetical protein